jgi:hypothetical protein
MGGYRDKWNWKYSMPGKFRSVCGWSRALDFLHGWNCLYATYLIWLPWRL